MIDFNKILLVDDDFLIQEIIKEILETRNYVVETAANGKEALEIFQKNNEYLMIISDFNMPVMNGLELIQTIRNEKSEIPVIMLTGNDEVSSAMTAINSGANDYLLKDENIQDTIFISIDRVIEKQKLVEENKKLMKDLIRKNGELEIAHKIAEEERNKADKLLLNILPAKVAEELKENGKVKPVLFPFVSVMFADIKGFTKAAWTMEPQDLLRELDKIFEEFDHICERHNIEKLKTIGDAYMCAGGLPEQNNTHFIDIILCAIEFKNIMEVLKANSNKSYDIWQLRLGVHSGSVMAGVVGKTKTVYDIWGDAVNVASRMESNGEAGKINVSNSLYEKTKDFFDFEYRGKLDVKNRGSMEMYFVKGIKSELSTDSTNSKPNEIFLSMYNEFKTKEKKYVT